jgi:NAD dependent epimerase/dehydratase
MNWSGKKVLVTGAGGFLGSHLTEALVERGASVRAFLRYTSGGSLGNLAHLAQSRLHEMEVVRSDLRDPEAVRRATRGVDTVFHLGALNAIPYSYLDPRSVLETNLIGTLNVLEAARAETPRRVLHTSSSEVYGTARYTPMDEEHSQRAHSPYAASKIAADKLVEAFQRSFQLPVVTIRPFNTYGPRQSARAIIPTIIIQALRGHAVGLGSLTPVRDFTFVTDMVRGFVQAAECEDLCGEELNFGTGEAMAIGDLARMIFASIGEPRHIVDDPRRVRPEGSEVMKLVADNRKAIDRIGWRPQMNLAEGLAHTIAWFRKHLESYNSEEYSF